MYRYEKDRLVRNDASPRTATRWDGHFSDPKNAAKEEQLEQRLQSEFEDPVNEFLEKIGDPAFSFSEQRVRALAGYTRMLFTRSRSRQGASKIVAEDKVGEIRALLADETKLDELELRCIAFTLESGVDLSKWGWSPREEVKRSLRRQIAEHTQPDAAQRDYIQALETMMDFPDEPMVNGSWEILHTCASSPFVIGDAPVVTWDRVSEKSLAFGVGFAEPNVEVFLPVSPTACIRVLPQVKRTRKIQCPTIGEVNAAQARFATQHCFTNRSIPALDAILQLNFGKMRMGIDGFRLRRREAGQLLFRILMNDGKPVAF